MSSHFDRLSMRTSQNIERNDPKKRARFLLLADAAPAALEPLRAYRRVGIAREELVMAPLKAWPAYPLTAHWVLELLARIGRQERRRLRFPPSLAVRRVKLGPGRPEQLVVEASAAEISPIAA